MYQETNYVNYGTVFETEDYNINLRRPAANREFEVMLPIDSVLRFKREYRGKTSFESRYT